MALTYQSTRLAAYELLRRAQDLPRPHYIRTSFVVEAVAALRVTFFAA